MSKNFELLQQVQRDRELFHTDGAAPPRAENKTAAQAQSNGDSSKRAIMSAARALAEFMESLKGDAKAESAVKRTNGSGKRRALDVKELAREQEFRLVEQVFLQPGPKEAPRLVLFAGVEHGDGSSWVCAHIAEALAAQVTGSVCLVDANLRAPALHQCFGIANRYGFSDSVRERRPSREYAQRVREGNLWLLPCGSPVEVTQSWLRSERLQVQMADLRREFDHVLVDTAPVNLYPDALALGQLSDAVILVLKANSTRRQGARRAKEKLEAAKLRLLGVTLNRRTFPIPESIYSKL